MSNAVASIYSWHVNICRRSKTVSLWIFSTIFSYHLTSPLPHADLWSPNVTWPHQIKTRVCPTAIFYMTPNLLWAQAGTWQSSIVFSPNKKSCQLFLIPPSGCLLCASEPVCCPYYVGLSITLCLIHTCWQAISQSPSKEYHRGLPGLAVHSRSGCLLRLTELVVLRVP